MDDLKVINFALEDLRQQALTKFITRFIAILETEGFSFVDLVESLLSWAYQNQNHKGVNDELIRALEDLRSLVSGASR